MNRMDGYDGDYVIEVLVAKADWHEDVKAETKKRPQRSCPEHNDKTKGISGAQLKLSRGSKSPQEGRFQRIRIRSETILRALGSLSECEKIESEPTLEFCRPFRILEDFHGDMKRKLVEMEDAQKPEGDSPSTGPGNLLQGTAGIRSDESVQMEKPKIFGEDTSDVIEADEADRKSDRSTETALEQMRCYVDFVEQVVLPIRSQFQNQDKKVRRRVRYEEITYLFRPGSLAFLPLAQSGQTLHRSAAQQVWRMASCIVSDHSIAFDEGKGHFRENSGETSWDMYCLDFDGEKLLPIWTNIEFDFFDGERDITSLKCYPLEFHPNYAALLEEQERLGRTFKSCIAESVRHLYYSGWTFITGIRAEPLVDDKGEPVNYPEYIEIEVVIDFKETLRNYPKWETSVVECNSRISSWETEYAEIELLVWEEYPNGLGGFRRSRSYDFPILSREDTLYSQEAKEWAANDRFIASEGSIAIKDDEWTDEDLALLPKRLFGYVLRERRFARLEVQGINLNSQQSRITLQDIQMPEPRRKIIRSVVSAHFKARQNEKQGMSTVQLDVVQGKGKGLVILLHRAPGVGKTATAEAVAIENRKPLFPITCGDLGFSPSAVDKSLRDTFRYAHLWDCILLLDEADVFLTQRDRNDGNLERNALVGVLECYSGILFLTTNRVGALDEAFRSRVHLSLFYPHLSLDDTIAILQSNLNRLPRIEHANDKSSNDGYIKVLDNPIKKFVKDEYKKYSRDNKKKKGPWNGRQIRNAVQIAAGLALYDKEASCENDGLPAILTADHFRSVAETTSEFEAYLKSTKKGDETFQARARQDRDDDFEEEEA
ncbi:AAA domain-containing protein [Fusarium sp. LHS14.1]|nr:AAA domain-containing protein [Fusarium sp. LHS14.1]